MSKISYNRTASEKAFRSMFVIGLNKQFNKFLEVSLDLGFDSPKQFKYKFHVLDFVSEHMKECRDNNKFKEYRQTMFFFVHLVNCFEASKTYGQLQKKFIFARDCYFQNESEYYHNKNMNHV